MSHLKEKISDALIACGREIFIAFYESSLQNGTQLYYRRGETAEMLAVSAATIDNWRNRGIIKPSYPFGKDGEARYSHRAILDCQKRIEKGID